MSVFIRVVFFSIASIANIKLPNHCFNITIHAIYLLFHCAPERHCGHNMQGRGPVGTPWNISAVKLSSEAVRTE